MGLQIRRPKGIGKRILTLTAALVLAVQPFYVLGMNRTAAAVDDADTTVPSITIKQSASPRDGTLGLDPYSRISFKLYDAGKNLQEVRLNGHQYKRGGQWNDLNWQNITKSHLIQGQNTAVVRDTAGNQSTVTFGYDSIAPRVVSLKHSNNNDNQLVNTDVTSTLTMNEPVQTPEGWTAVAGSNDTVFTKVSTANNKGTMTIVDRAGNQTTQFFEVKRIDKTAPTFDVQDGQAIQAVSQTVVVTEANLSSIEVDGVVVKPEGTKPRYSVNVSGEGSHTVVASDKAGNKTTVTFVLDVTAPTYDVAMTKTSYLDTEDVVATVTARDSGSGVKGIDFVFYGVSSDGKEIVRTCSKAVGKAKAELVRDCTKRLPAGTYVVTAVAYDAAGNALEDEDEIANKAVAFEVKVAPPEDGGNGSGTETPSPGGGGTTPGGEGTGTAGLPLILGPIIDQPTRQRVTRSTPTPQPATNILLPTAFGTATPATGSVPADDNGEVLGVTRDNTKGEVLGLSDDQTTEKQSNWYLWLLPVLALGAAAWWMIAAARRRKREEGF